MCNNILKGFEKWKTENDELCKGKRIPISAAKEISKTYDYDKSIIVGVNDNSKEQVYAIATYGKNKELCKEAEHIGQVKIKECLEKYFGKVSE